MTVGELFGLLCLVYGMRRLHKTVNPVNPAQQELPLETSRRISAQESIPVASPPERLALQPQPISVTEGTTELIEESQAVPVLIKQARTTGSME